MPQQQQYGGGGGGGYRGGMGGGASGGYPQNYYYYNYYNSMFIRRAQDEETEQNEGGEQPPKDQSEHHSRYSYGSKPFKPRGYRYNKGEEHYYEPKMQGQNQLSQEEREKRTRINSENFPPLVSANIESKSVAQPVEESKGGIHEKNIIRYKKDEIVGVFNNLNNLKIHTNMKDLNDEEVPVLEKKAKPTLEVIQPSPKKSTEPSKSRKQSTLTNP